MLEGESELLDHLSCDGRSPELPHVLSEPNATEHEQDQKHDDEHPSPSGHLALLDLDVELVEDVAVFCLYDHVSRSGVVDRERESGETLVAVEIGAGMVISGRCLDLDGALVIADFPLDDDGLALTVYSTHLAPLCCLGTTNIHGEQVAVNTSPPFTGH